VTYCDIEKGKQAVLFGAAKERDLKKKNVEGERGVSFRRPVNLRKMSDNQKQTLKETHGSRRKKGGIQHFTVDTHYVKRV